MSEVTPTRSALLELQEERRSMGDAYDFLDEKRTLLAGEIVQQLRLHRIVMVAFETSFQKAVDSLKAASAWHGMEGLQCYPTAQLEQAELKVLQHAMLGVVLREAELKGLGPEQAEGPAISADAEHCKACFQQLTMQAVKLAALQGNLLRLYQEYQHTERRARALEDILLPEMEQSIAQIDAQLEALDLEEAVRVRRRRQGFLARDG